jgi:trimeric autotransporter adhesin
MRLVPVSMGRGLRKNRGLLQKAGLLVFLIWSTAAAPRSSGQQPHPAPAIAATKSSTDIPDGDLDLSDLWPSSTQSAVETDSIALQPALSITGGTGGASTPSFTGDPSFDGDTFEVNGQNDIVIPYFQMADQMRLDFEDGHQLQGPAEQQPIKAAIKKLSAPARTTATRPFDAGRFHGAAYWNGGSSIFNAQPFLLAGDPVPNPAYETNNYGLTMGMAPFLPGHTKPSRKDFIEVSYSGQLSSSLVNQYGLVPTGLERQGNFSELRNSDATLIPIYPPRSFTPYPNNTIDTPLNSAALALLRYLPPPNLSGTGLNYRLLTTKGTHGNTVGASYTHNFGPVDAKGQPVDGGPTQQVNVTVNYGDLATDLITLFPALAGRQRLTGYSFDLGYNFGKRNWLATLNLFSNRNNAQTRNFYTGGKDIATSLGIHNDYSGSPINTNPLNYGLPSVILNGFASFTETQPNFQLTQATGISGSADWVHGVHVIRFGGKLQRTEFNLFGGTNATGTLVFTGGYTQIEGASTTDPVLTTGSSFADFLLGLPQQTRIESPDQKAYTRQTNWSAWMRDDWKILPNLTILAGLRYDYYSPYLELHNRLSTLDYNADFSDIAPVQPGDVGPLSGRYYPRSLIQPDRNNFAPHVGFALQPGKTTAMRAGYGIYYTVAQYGTFIQNLAYQPPFAHVEVNGNIPHSFTVFTLQAPFGNQADFGNYAINQDYKMPYVQVWYLDIQQTLPLKLILDYGYAGAKGTKLDIISTPGAINKTPFASAFFDYEDSTAFSNFNSFVARIRREMINGLALSATYAYSHSIDNASSTNAGLPVVAQDPDNLLAEESNSSFDIRHQLTGSFLYQLPFGPHRTFIHGPSLASHFLDGISLDGFFAVATGVPLTPYVSASVAEAERGTHGSVRPDRVPGVPIRAGGGHLDHWFNTAAFSTAFAPGQLYGTASRFSIPGPGVESVNLSASKNFPLGETWGLLLRATASNALNTVQYSDVDTQVGSSTFGYVSGTQPMRQLTFLAKFTF